MDRLVLLTHYTEAGTGVESVSWYFPSETHNNFWAKTAYTVISPILPFFSRSRLIFGGNAGWMAGMLSLEKVGALSSKNSEIQLQKAALIYLHLIGHKVPLVDSSWRACCSSWGHGHCEENRSTRVRQRCYIKQDHNCWQWGATCD